MVHRKALAQRIRLEIEELEQTVSIITHHWQRFTAVTEDSAFADFLERLEESE